MKNCTRIALVQPKYKHTEQSLKIILEWANNKFQRYSKLSTPVDEKLHCLTQYKHTAQSLILLILICTYVSLNIISEHY